MEEVRKVAVDVHKLFPSIEAGMLYAGLEVVAVSIVHGRRWIVETGVVFPESYSRQMH